MLSRSALAKVARNATARRSLSTRASAILSALDIPTNQEVSGVYDGVWGGTGELLESVCPATGEVLARVTSVSILSELHSSLAAASSVVLRSYIL